LAAVIGFSHFFYSQALLRDPANAGLRTGFHFGKFPLHVSAPSEPVPTPLPQRVPGGK
jgi:hypothetical protein